MIEIERKFLTLNPPKEYLSWTCLPIKQGYLAFTKEETEVRIRQVGDNFFQTVKTGKGLIRKEIEIEITQQQFEQLWPATENSRLFKKRYLKKMDNFLIELDVYEDKLQDLMIVEVEFNSKEESKNFSPLPWFDKEITDDEEYTSKNVAY